MATVRVANSSCGCKDILMENSEVVVRVCSADSSGTYVYTCPECSQIVTAAAEPRIVELLVTSGCRLITWHLPEELTEAHEGDPIDHDDLLDFHALLQGDDWIDALRQDPPDP